jgi:homocysteine S-methyltransferase
MTPEDFRAWLAATPTPAILDGGLASALESQGHSLPDSDLLWTSRLLLENPPALRDAAARYLAAGADIVSTATYQVSQAALSAAFVCHDGAAAVMQSAVDLAREAVVAESAAEAAAAAGRATAPLVALSLGPYASTLGEGAEYRGYGAGGGIQERMADFHRRRARVFFAGALVGAGRGADVAAYETFPAVDEAIFVVKMISGEGLVDLTTPPFWISFQCRSETQLASGERLADAARAVLAANDGDPRLVALGVNCCNPAWLADLVRILRDSIRDYMQEEGRRHQPTIAVVAYPNSGEQWEDGGWVWPQNRITETAWAETVLATGADIVGGCCRCDFDNVIYNQLYQFIYLVSLSMHHAQVVRWILQSRGLIEKGSTF